MTIEDHIATFAGLPIQNFGPGDQLSSPVQSAVRLSCEGFDDSEGLSTAMAELLADPLVQDIEALVIGVWSGGFEGIDSTAAVEMLVSACDSFPKLRALFLGDMTYEECEISWIVQSDLSPLLQAYPKLETLGVRGGNSLTFGSIDHSSLQTLVIESGGLPSSVILEIAEAHLPALENLELWLGDEQYGRDLDQPTLQKLLNSPAFPKLKSLGLCNDSEADTTAQILAASPILQRLEVLDLSRGALGDIGAAALISSPYIRTLKKLDLHFHYITPPMIKKLKSLDIEVDVSDPQEESVYGDQRFRTILASE